MCSLCTRLNTFRRIFNRPTRLSEIKRFERIGPREECDGYDDDAIGRLVIWVP